MLKLIVSDKVLVDVRGALRDEEGVERAFDFGLVMRRDPQDELLSAERDDVPLKEFIVSRASDWRKVCGEDGRPLPFTREHLDELLAIAGMRAFIYRCYLEAISPKARRGN